MESGLNIATRAGEGQAYVYDWHELHQNINNVLQKEAQHMQALRDNYTKSSLMAADAIKTLRPIDIEPFKNAYNKFKDADLTLANPKIQKDIKAFQYYTDQKMAALAELNQIQAESKATAQRILDLQTENYKTNGVNAKPDFYDKLNFLNNLPSNQIMQKGLLMPTHYFFDKSPIDFNKVSDAILGGKVKTPNISIPTEDKKMINNYIYEIPKNASIIMKNGVPDINPETGKPKLDYTGIIQNTASIFKSAGQNTKLLYDINQMYKNDIQTNPELVQKTFETAKKLLDASGQDGNQLVNSPEYYLLAKNIVSADALTKGYITKQLPTYETKRQDALLDYQQKRKISSQYQIYVNNNNYQEAGRLLNMINENNINNGTPFSFNNKQYKDIPVNDKNIYSKFSVVANVPEKRGFITTMKQGRREPNKFLYDPETGNYIAFFYKYDPNTFELTDEVDSSLTKVISPETFNLAQLGVNSILKKGGVDVLEAASANKNNPPKIGKKLTDFVLKKSIKNDRPY